MNQVAFDQLRYNISAFPDHHSYMDDCLELAVSNLRGYESISELEKDLPKINAYEHINAIEDPKNLIYLDDKTLNPSDYVKAWKCVLDGRLFTEHFVAGEGTRLALGTKFLINLQKDLPMNEITAGINWKRATRIWENHIRMQTRCHSSDLLPLSFGVRHMLQYSYDIHNLSKFMGYDPDEVLLKQKMLIVLNETTADTIMDGFIKHGFYGFARQNILFMIQKAYHGINLKNEEVFYDHSAPKRLHNHGQIAIQQTMPDEIFYITENHSLYYLTDDQFGDILKDMEIKISYNIEDLDYLTGSINYEGLALALKKSKESYNMLMEVLPNNSDSPQKGGMAAFDPILERDVMIESFQLNEIENHQIKFLNKNVNYYPKPYIVWEMVKKRGLNMPVAIKDGFIYFQPVIGDINFLVKTGIFTRKNAIPINAWKSAETTPLAIDFMRMQDMQEGFKDYARLFFSLPEG